ncbi:MAG TPA: FAD:protein FMN transferase [Thermohalobaculum sp.]|nr:FAD:protein FMN transferase [Thermohalobaculum sp.]
MSLTRRRFLLMAAAAGALGRVAPERWEWRGSAMGAEARIVLAGPRAEAEAAIKAVTAEIGRLEAIFSLHRPDSQLARLNAAGRLAAPAGDLRDVLAAAARWKRTTEGAFEPGVQPLWAHWVHWAAGGGAGAAEDALARVRASRVTLGPGHVALSPGSALTLNGIAQGTVADRVAALLARHGFHPPLIDAGEMRLPGAERRAVDLPGAGLRLRVAEAAIATSAPGAFPFDAAGRHHLFEPLTGASPGWWREVTVVAPTAEAADALSTAFAVSPPAMVGDIAAGLDGVAVLATGRDGRTRLLGRRRIAIERARA